MTTPLTAEDYRHQLASLLPRGPAWTRDPASVLQRLLAGLARSLARLDAAASSLPDEARPSTTYHLLPDWERALGLPDVCSALGATITERRAAVVATLQAPETVSLAEYHRVASFYGITLRISELDQARADAIPGLDTAGGRWRFVWWISIPTEARIRYFDTLSDVNTPLASWDQVPGHAELECRLRAMAPAHTHLVFHYHSAPRRVLWLDRAVKWLGRPVYQEIDQVATD